MYASISTNIRRELVNRSMEGEILDPCSMKVLLLWPDASVRMIQEGLYASIK